MSDLNIDAREALLPIVAVLRRLGARFYVGGSLASSAHGMSRSTIDADLVVDLRPEHVEPLAEALESEFYLDRRAIREAIARRSSFNMIFLARMYKVDVFILKHNPFDQECMRRARPARLVRTDPATEFPFGTPEDTILHKLMWYRLGGEVSERQWQDILNIMEVQASRLDEAYLDHWASELALTELLARARQTPPIDHPPGA